MEGAGGIGGLLARSVYSGGAWGSHNSYHADGNGNVTALVDSGQAVSAGYRYNPYGAVIGVSGGAMTNQNVYRFSSKEQMPNSGLYYYGYRFYDPNLQRWLNRDPIGELGGINLYALCQNSPIDYADTNGRYRFGWSLFAGFTTRLAVNFAQEWNKARCPQTGNCRACCNLTAAALGTSCAAMGVAGGLVTGGLIGTIPVIGIVAGPIAGIISGGAIAGECLRDVSIGRWKCLQGCPCKDH
jgi:RHS repeat-associated protein